MSMLLMPEVLLLGWTLVLLLLHCAALPMRALRFADLAMYGVVLVLISTWIFSPETPALWEGMYVYDEFSLFFKRLFLIALFLVLWMGKLNLASAPPSAPWVKGEFFMIPLITTVGLLLLASAVDFVVMFVALELVTISFYVLVAFNRHRSECLEAGVKYLIVGGLSTAFLVYGITFLFGSVNTTSFNSISLALTILPASTPILFAMILITVGIGFKIAAVPFHAWAPDVYQGAPTPVTAFLATASKVAGFVILLRLFFIDVFHVPNLYEPSREMFSMLAAFSILLGSYAALPQRNLKRLLGYSSIANAGFLLMAVASLSDRGFYAILFYLSVYVLAVLMVFFLICMLSDKLGGEDLRHYAGLSQRSPLLAFVMAVCFISLAGLPPLAGFVAKLAVFSAAWEAGLYWLVLIGILGALAGIYYYLGIVKAMYWIEPANREKIEVPPSVIVLIVIVLLTLIFFGVYPSP